MLNNKDKIKLRKIAHQNIKSLVKINIGKGYIDSNLINSINNAFLTHEIIKISFLKSSLVEHSKRELTLELIDKLSAYLLEEKGNTLLLYKENKDIKDHIIL